MQTLEKILIKQMKVGEFFRYKTSETNFIALILSLKYNNVQAKIIWSKNPAAHFKKGKTIDFYEDHNFYKHEPEKENPTFKAKNGKEMTATIKKT